MVAPQAMYQDLQSGSQPPDGDLQPVDDKPSHLLHLDSGDDIVVFMNFLVYKEETLKVAREMKTPEGGESAQTRLSFNTLKGLTVPAAARVILADQTCAKFAQKLTGAVPEQLRRMGITARCTEIVHKGGIVTVQATVTDFDRGKAGGSPLFDCCSKGPCSKGDDESANVTHKIVGTMAKKLPAMVLADAPTGVQLELDVRDEKDQRAMSEAIFQELHVSPSMRLCGSNSGGCCIG